MNKLLAVALCCVLFTSVTAKQVEDEEKFTIDQASQALQDLLVEAQENLDGLNKNWEENKPVLEANIAAVQDQLARKTQECQNLDGVLAADQAELDNARRYVAWLHKRIQENEDQIVQILADRCVQNNNHVEALKNDKIALSLVQFLRAQVQAKESFDFAQRKSFMTKLQSFLAVYRRGNLSELVELQKQVAADYEVNVNADVHGRSDEEIGSQHVDNNQGELELNGFQSGHRQAWGEVRAELLAILDELEQTIQTKIANAQEDEIRSSSAAADLKRKLEHENEVYNAELAKWNAIVVRLEGVVAQDEANVAQCRREESGLQVDLQAAEEALETATQQYNHKRANFEEEVQVFVEVIAIYNPSTASQDESFKSRADDYIEDGNFDDADYNDRDVPDIDLLSQN